MIELFTADTPNGKKISIMLEEIKFDYKVTKIDLGKGEQFNPNFRKISPFSKIPVIIDHKNEETIFLGHSTGCVNAIEESNNNKFIKKLILMDPVDNKGFLNINKISFIPNFNTNNEIILRPETWGVP